MWRGSREGSSYRMKGTTIGKDLKDPTTNHGQLVAVINKAPIVSTLVPLGMYNRPSYALIGVALLSNLASGFSCSAPLPPLPKTTSAFLRNQPPPAACTINSLNKDIIRGQSRRDILTSSSINSPVMVRGGSDSSSALSASPTVTSDAGDNAITGEDLNLTTSKVLASLWGAFGVVYILVKAIKRVLPIALEPFSKAEGVVPLTQFQLA